MPPRAVARRFECLETTRKRSVSSDFASRSTVSLCGSLSVSSSRGGRAHPRNRPLALERRHRRPNRAVPVGCGAGDTGSASRAARTARAPLPARRHPFSLAAPPSADATSLRSRLLPLSAAGRPSGHLVECSPLARARGAALLSCRPVSPRARVASLGEQSVRAVREGAACGFGVRIERAVPALVSTQQDTHSCDIAEAAPLPSRMRAGRRDQSVIMQCWSGNSTDASGPYVQRATALTARAS